MNKEPSYFCVMKYAFSILLILNMFLSQAQITKVKVNTKKNQPNEPSIAINPLNKAEIVAAANIDEIYFSQDTGKTWIEFEAQSDLGIYALRTPKLLLLLAIKVVSLSPNLSNKLNPISRSFFTFFF
mgnify:CR=1 FL=1